MNTHFSRQRTWAIAAAAVIAVGGAGLWALSRDAQAQDASASKDKDAKGGKNGKGGAPVQVTLAPVKVQDVPRYLIGIGTVTPTFAVTVKARVDGQLDKVGFTEGQDVRKGQVLAVIDPRALQAQLLQAQAALAKDQATLNNARLDLQRYTTLVAQDAATQQQLDTQRALVETTQASIKSDEAAIRYAQVQLSYTTVTAPISGRVGVRLVDPGNIVSANTTSVVQINQIDPISLLFTLPDGAVQETNRALAASPKPLLVEAFPRDSTELLGAGTLTVVNNQIDTTSGTVQLKASFPNPQHHLWPGQYVNARLFIGTYKKAITIPDVAVQRSQSGVFAWVASSDGQTVRSQQIALTQIQDGVAIVSSGLAAGDKVVVDGMYQLQSGSRITLSKRGGAASGAAAGDASSASASAGDGK